MKTYLTSERFFQRFDSRIRVLREHGACRVHNVDALRSIGFHQLCLDDEILRWTHMRHHQEANRLQIHFPGTLEVLLGDIGLGTLGGDTYNLSTLRYCLFEFLEGAYAG